MTAAKPEEPNHKERTMDAALLRRSLKPQLIFMASFTNDNKSNENCSDNNNKYTKKEIKTNTLIWSLQILAPSNNHAAIYNIQ